MSSRTLLTLLLLPILFLSALSLAMLGSIAPSKLVAQAIVLVFSAIIGLAVFRIGARNIAIFSNMLYGLLLLFLTVTMLFGRVTRGSVRWLEIAGLRGQISELAKPILLLTGVSLLEQPWGPKRRDQLSQFGAFSILMLIPIILVFLEPDLGTGIVLFVMAAVLLWCSGLPRWILGVVLLLGVLMVPLSRYVLADYQLRRIESFINPRADPKGSGYQVIQSIIAIGSGQFWGRGLGHGTQSRLRFLPERQTDFMFASLGEELGFVGGIFTLSLYAVIMLGLMEAVFGARERFDYLLYTGCAGWLFFQASTNIAMNLGLAPVTGITLPFLSAGGSSLVSSSVMLALAASRLRPTHLS